MTLLKRRLFLKAAAAVALAPLASAAEPAKKDPLTMVVMDPLAGPLACSCVKGYAQRDYEKLAKHLTDKLGRPVTVVFGSSLVGVMEKKSDGKADIVIGKESVVRHEAKEGKLGMAPVAALSGSDGKTTMTGMVVVYGKDAALTAGDLKGYKVLFGDASAAEKHAAPLALFKDLGVDMPAKPDICGTCTEGAKAVVAAGKNGEKTAAVISSYAKPLLEGCGTVQKGDLRVVGETDPVPFIVAFVNEKLPEATRTDIQKALLGIGKEKELLTALETKDGFVELPAKKK
jgi:ABC-type phosphate/phosphonate transport system substrate-binding protein